MDTCTTEIADLESQLADAKEAAYAAIQPTVDEVLEKIDAGEDFDALIEQYGQDPGMETSPAKEDGYPVSADSTNWVTEFRDAAMALENVAIDIRIGSEYGIHIIKYVSDAAEGEVGLDAVREALEASFHPEAGRGVQRRRRSLGGGSGRQDLQGPHELIGLHKGELLRGVRPGAAPFIIPNPALIVGQALPWRRPTSQRFFLPKLRTRAQPQDGSEAPPAGPAPPPPERRGPGTAGRGSRR